jgi:hypothetical protein
MKNTPKITVDKAALEAFRAALPEEHQTEFFNGFFGTIQYDVITAKFLSQNSEVENLPVAEWAKNTMHDGPEEKTEADGTVRINLFSGVSDRELKEIWETVDTQRPIIFAIYTLDDGRQTVVLIDGNKRLRKAFLLKQETIPAICLTEEQSEAATTYRMKFPAKKKKRTSKKAKAVA